MTAQLLGSYQRRADPDDVRKREAERQQREAADTRTAAEQWLNDPPPGRSALAQKPARPT